MKKNFFKKLSFVMALAMTVSVVAPAASAFAATTPSLSATTKYLYVNETGKASEYDFNIKNLAKGAKVVYSTDNKAVATVDAKSGLTEAVSRGTAHVSAKITLATKKTLTLKATVYVRDYVKSVDITAPATEYTVATEYDFNRTFVNNGGSATTSSICRWSVDKTTATVDATTGKITFNAADTYKVTVDAFNSAADYESYKTSKDATLVKATKTVEVKVTNPIAAVTQVDKNTVKVEFKGAVDKLATTDIIVGKVVSGTPVKQVVKSVEAVEGTDKKAYKVVLFNDFATNTVYQVTYGTSTKSITTATANVADVASMTITPVTAEVNVPTKVYVKLFNAAGVDITNADLLARVSLTNSSAKAYLSQTYTTLATPVTINMFTVGDTTTVGAVFHTWDYDTTGTEKNLVKAEATITCVAKAAVSAGTLTAWTVAKSVPTDKFAAVNHAVAAEDTTYKLYVKTTKADGTVITNVDNDTKFKFQSSDNSVLYVNTDSNSNLLYPLKSGAATIVISYSEDGWITSTVVDAVTVTVNAKRVATNLKLDATSFGLSNEPAVADTKVVTLDVEDQYQTDMTETGVAVDNVSTSATLLASGLTPTISGDKVTFHGTGAAVGTYNYKITSNDIVRYVTITVSEPKDAASVHTTGAVYYRLSLTDADSTYDTKFDTSALGDITADFYIKGFANNNVASQVKATTGGAFKIKIVNPDGTEIQNNAAVTLATVDGNVSSIKLADFVSGGTSTKLKEGTYIIKLFETKSGNDVLADQITFLVKDTTVKPTLVVKTNESSATTLAGAIAECFKVSYNDTEYAVTYTDLTGASEATSGDDVLGTGKSVLVKTVHYTDPTTFFTFDVAVNLTISYK